jgi:glycosyltransferase involved in cell wall biosynthesis
MTNLVANSVLSRAVEVSPDHPPRAGTASAPARSRRVNVVLPVYNEGEHVEHVARQVLEFAGANPRYHFLFVSDGSKDETPGAIERAIRVASDRDAASRVRLIAYRANAGKGWAVSRGVQEAIGEDDDLVIFTDGDLAYSLDHLPRLEAALATHDVAIGTRRDEGGQVGAHTLRRWMGWTFNRIARLALGRSYTDTQAGLKGFRLGAARTIFPALRVSNFSFDVELLYLAHRMGYSIEEVPAQVSSFHRHKSSNVNLLRDPLRMLMSLAAIRLNGARGVYERSATGKNPLVLVSFDAEEFDIPLEYGRALSKDEQMAIAGEGMRRALRVLDEVPARATFFTTAAFAEAHPELVRQAVDRGHEIASHASTHTGFEESDLLRSREALERISGQPVRGFRRPRFAPTDLKAIESAGYSYDSSINPIWLPGRYNGWKHPRRAFRAGSLTRIPLSATPLLRLPLFWLAFKNLPMRLIRATTRACLRSDGYAALVFHPWELCDDLASYGLPRSVRRIEGEALQDRLIAYLRWASRRATFASYSQLDDAMRGRASAHPQIEIKPLSAARA